MNRLIPKIGSAVVTVSVFLFAVFIITDFTFGSYLVWMFLPIGFIIMEEGFRCECPEDRKAAAGIGMVFAAIYGVLIFLVYFAQDTTVTNEQLTEQAERVLNYKYGGLMFTTTCWATG